MKTFCRSRWLALVLILVAAPRTDAQEPSPAPLFPFVLPWDDNSPSVVNVSSALDKPAGRDGFVTVKNGHLYAGSKRLRLFGVNLAFAANFPSHDDATKIAGRMAKFGINAVRFHHMDMQSAPSGIWAADKRSLDPGQLERLDFFIDQLKSQGIYADLNLHVSRTYPDLPTSPAMPDFHKGVDNFFPQMIELQRRYARDLLLHQNPYTKNRYIDEPAVVFVEINNENGLLHEWWNGGLDDMPALYVDELTKQWNAWLTAKYKDSAQFLKAWSAGEIPLGEEILNNGRFAQGMPPWALEQHGSAKATAKVIESPEADPARALRVEVDRPSDASWHVQIIHSGLHFQGGSRYTLRFRAKADAPRRLTVAASQAHAPWKVLWSGSVPLTTKWQTYELAVAPSETEDTGRIALSGLGSHVGTTWVADLSLRPGGLHGLQKDDGFNHCAIIRHADLASRTESVQRDWIRFLYDTEERYWTGMSRFLKDDLKSRSLVIGAQMGWSPFPIQAKLDVIDSHSYWHHPEFPGRGWDPVNWRVRNEPMTASADGGTLPGLGLSRVAGKPFICTEYNHSAPNTYAAETFPLVMAYASLQDWDGVFAFAYSHRRDDWAAGKISGFFDIDQHPTKMATLPASVTLFQRGDVHSSGGLWTASATLDMVLERVRRAGPAVGAGAFGATRQQALRGPVAVELTISGTAKTIDAAATAPEFDWSSRGLVTINAPRTKALIGALPARTKLGLGQVTIWADRQGSGVIMLTAMDGPDFHSPGRILVTAAGLAENTAMGWKDDTKTSVGADWGRAPSLVEGIPVLLSFGVPAPSLRAWALDERGRRREPVPVQNSALGEPTIEIGPGYKTLWYEIEIGPPH